jgi:hypothetical protein
VERNAFSGPVPIARQAISGRKSTTTKDASWGASSAARTTYSQPTTAATEAMAPTPARRRPCGVRSRRDSPAQSTIPVTNSHRMRGIHTQSVRSPWEEMLTTRGTIVRTDSSSRVRARRRRWPRVTASTTTGKTR